MILPTIINKEYDSGFKAEIILRPHFNQRFFGIIIDFGSGDPQKVAGSAHFLEHKLFAKKDGDLAQKFEELGSQVNAFTSFNETMFYCIGLDHTNKLLELLFRLVGEPYFTAKNVAQEKLIIQQELAMYQDEPDWGINNALMQQMFGQTNLGFDVAGSRSSINAINQHNLSVIYQENYIPPKMNFVACGDFSNYQTQAILRSVNKLQMQYFTPKKSSFDYKIVKPKIKNEPLILKGNSNLFGLGIRLENFKKVLSSLDLAQILLEIMLKSKLSVMSPFFEKMKKQKLLHNPLQISLSYTRQGNFVTIFGVSSHSKVVIEAIKKELSRTFNQADIQFSHTFFDLQKKYLLAQNMRSQNDLFSLAVETAEANLDGENMAANLQQLQVMKFEDYVAFCTDLMKDFQVCSALITKKV